MKIYLASASPRRKELLEQIGLEFEVCVSKVQEQIAAVGPGKAVEELAAQKARAVLEELSARKAETVLKELPDRRPEAVPEELSARTVEAVLEELPARKAETVPEEFLVIGADTVVALKDRILGKPADEKEAAQMLVLLAGKTHEVYTGVALLHRMPDGAVESRIFHEATKVTFFPMDGEEIRRYAATGDCLDKAGAYGIQGFCARYIQGIEGDYNNVVGLPVGRLYQEAKEWLGA
ncbi:MAG: Maf family protein [bacterium]|nr:Maf family protein [bacterium]